MKTVQLLAVALTLLLGACGKDDSGAKECAGTQYVGSWLMISGADVIRIEDSCAGTSSSCGSTFTMPVVQGSTGTATLKVLSSNGAPGCLAVGNHSVTFNRVAPNQITFNFGSGDIAYRAN